MELTNANPISMYVVMLNSIICFGLYQISWTVSCADVFCVTQVTHILIQYVQHLTTDIQLSSSIH